MRLFPGIAIGVNVGFDAGGASVATFDFGDDFRGIQEFRQVVDVTASRSKPAPSLCQLGRET
jgi:hypothetical protein